MVPPPASLRPRPPCAQIAHAAEAPPSEFSVLDLLFDYATEPLLAQPMAAAAAGRRPAITDVVVLVRPPPRPAAHAPWLQVTATLPARHLNRSPSFFPRAQTRDSQVSPSRPSALVFAPTTGKGFAATSGGVGSGAAQQGNVTGYFAFAFSWDEASHVLCCAPPQPSVSGAFSSKRLASPCSRRYLAGGGHPPTEAAPPRGARAWLSVSPRLSGEPSRTSRPAARCTWWAPPRSAPSQCCSTAAQGDTQTSASAVRATPLIAFRVCAVYPVGAPGNTEARPCGFPAAGQSAAEEEKQGSRTKQLTRARARIPSLPFPRIRQTCTTLPWRRNTKLSSISASRTTR